MNDFLKQDIFFFVTTIAVIIISILVIVITVYLVKILRDLKYISGKAKIEADLISEDLSDLRQNLKKGLRIKYLFSFFNNLWQRRKNSKDN